MFENHAARWVPDMGRARPAKPASRRARPNTHAPRQPFSLHPLPLTAARRRPWSRQRPARPARQRGGSKARRTCVEGTHAPHAGLARCHMPQAQVSRSAAISRLRGLTCLESLRLVGLGLAAAPPAPCPLGPVGPCSRELGSGEPGGASELVPTSETVSVDVLVDDGVAPLMDQGVSRRRSRLTRPLGSGTGRAAGPEPR